MKYTYILLASLYLSGAFVLHASAYDAAESIGHSALDTETLLSSYIGGCEDAHDLAAMVSVGAVILNRCGEPCFPDTISANGASLGIFPVPAPSPMAVYAARLALSGLDPTAGATFFFKSVDTTAQGDRYITFSVSGLCFAR